MCVLQNNFTTNKFVHYQDLFLTEAKLAATSFPVPEMMLQILIEARIHVILKAKKGLIPSILGVFELLKRFSEVGFNFPDDKDIPNFGANKYSI